MNSQKNLASVLVVSVFVSMPWVVTLCNIGTNPTVILPNRGQYIADGGAPVPPYPKPPVAFNSDFVIADGGAPVPPYPKPPVAALA
jgi:hypothetical protein